MFREPRPGSKNARYFFRWRTFYIKLLQTMTKQSHLNSVSWRESPSWKPSHPLLPRSASPVVARSGVPRASANVVDIDNIRGVHVVFRRLRRLFVSIGCDWGLYEEPMPMTQSISPDGQPRIGWVKMLLKWLLRPPPAPSNLTSRFDCTGEITLKTTILFNLIALS